MIKRMGLVLILIICITMFAGCAGSQKSAQDVAPSPSSGSAGYDMSKNEVAGEGAGLGYVGESIIRTTANKIIYRSDISLETKDFDKTIQSIEDKVREVEGYIESASIRGKGYKENDPKYAYFVIRVPKEDFQYIQKAAESWGNIVSINTSSENVTEQYYDTQARLETLNIQEERILELLKKADKIEDIITLERELQNIRYQIESHTTTIRKLDALVDYSSITINVREVDELSFVPKSFAQEIGGTIKDSLKGFIEFVKTAILVVVYLLPYLIVLAVIVLLVRKLLPIQKIPFIRRRKDD